MYFKLGFAVTLSFITAAVLAESSNSVPKINLDYVYGTGCPKSEQVFMDLYSAYKTDFSSFINLELNPYGNTTEKILENGTITFSCEHGIYECEGNKVHACVLNTTSDFGNKLKFVNCTLAYFSNTGPYPTEKCAQDSNIDLSVISRCLNDVRGNNTQANLLLSKYGEKVKSGQLIPYFVVNSSFDPKVSDNLMKNFKKGFCGLMSNSSLEACKSENSASTATLTVLPIVIFSFIFSKLYQ